MTPRIRTLTYVTAGALVIATGAGCGFLSSAKKVIGNVQIMANYTEKIQNGLKATYKAQYKDAASSKTVTVAQQPPKSVYITDTGPWIFNGSTSYQCDNSSGSMVCQKTTYTDTEAADAALAGSDLATGGFVVGELGVALVVASALVPSAKLVQSSETIAGQKSDCVTVSNLQGLDTGSDNGSDLSQFKMCITDGGVVSEFSGTDTAGKVEGSVMTSYSTQVDPSLFLPPAGAQIVDQNNLPSAPPSTPPSTGPSAPPSTPSSALPSAAPSAGSS